MTMIKRATAAVLMGAQWLLLAVAAMATTVADTAEDAAVRLRR